MVWGKISMASPQATMSTTTPKDFKSPSEKPYKGWEHALNRGTIYRLPHNLIISCPQRQTPHLYTLLWVIMWYPSLMIITIQLIITLSSLYYYYRLQVSVNRTRWWTPIKTSPDATDKTALHSSHPWTSLHVYLCGITHYIDWRDLPDSGKWAMCAMFGRLVIINCCCWVR